MALLLGRVMAADLSSMLGVHHEFKDCNVFAFKHLFKINWLINKLH